VKLEAQRAAQRHAADVHGLLKTANAATRRRLAAA
jgi:hypothetical protein